MYWCNDCNIWEHERCLVASVKREYIEGVCAAMDCNSIIVEIVNPDGKDKLTAILRGEVDAIESGEKGGVCQEVKCLKCGQTLT